MSREAESVRRYSPFFKIQKALKVLDYGTGTMRNALYLTDRGFRVYAADLPEQVERLRNRPATQRVKRLLATDELPQSRLNVDLVLSTYVFNIIMGQQERHSYLANAAANLRPGGYLLMEVRCRRPGDPCGDSCHDYFSCGECAKTLTHDELDMLLTPHGLRRVSHYYRSHALAAIYRRE
ncbi:MAG: class I SAM-dependent methyltransferase [Deltaproteobacteria bacterium]|nr:class I SAM-dependent methyltransferase [Deltaproteobacteria bacterium]